MKRSRWTFGAGVVAVVCGVACGSSSNGAAGQASGSDGGDVSPDGGTIIAADAGADAAVPVFGSELTPGSRIHGVYYETADGTSSLIGLHDMQLDIDCTWAFATDGVLRCLPTSNALATSPVGLVFSDSECTTATLEIEATDCAPAAKSYALAAVRACPSGSRVFSIGASVAKPTTTYARDNSGSCVVFGTPTTQQFFSMTEVGEANFVAGTATSTGDALARVMIAGNDGSTSSYTLRDRVNDVDCAFRLATDKTLRCLPSTIASVSDFADSNCSVPAASGALSSCASIAFATGAPTGCPNTTPVYSLGAKITTVFTGTPASCGVFDVTGSDFYATGGVFAPTSFVPGTLGTLEFPANARLARTTVSASTTSAFADTGFGPSFHDSQRNEDCVPFTAEDGKVRCLPVPIGDPTALAEVSLSGIQIFNDANCSVAAALGQTAPCTGPKYALDESISCGTASITMYPITGAGSGNIHAFQGTTCVSAPMPSGLQSYVIGPKLPASTFALLTKTVH